MPHDRSRAAQPGQVVGPVGDVAGVPALHRVVVGVVGEHGDLPCADARLDGEGLVAPYRQVLGEAQSMFLHQRTSEELGVRQREGQRRVVETDVRIALLEERLVDVTTVGADHLAHHDVGAVLVRTLHHALQRLRTEVVVGTDEVHVPPRGHLQGTVARRCRTAGVLLVENLDGARVFRREAVQFRTAPVSGSVVHGDDFKSVHTDALPHERVQALGEVWHRVVHGHDHGNIRVGQLATPSVSLSSSRTE